MQPFLSDQRLARRMVRTMDLGMAVHAAAADNAWAAVPHGETVVHRGRMSRADVTALAQHGHLRNEQPVVRRPVRVVARHAAFAAGGVLEQEWATLFRVARDAALIDPVADPELLHVG